MAHRNFMKDVTSWVEFSSTLLVSTDGDPQTLEQEKCRQCRYFLEYFSNSTYDELKRPFRFSHKHLFGEPLRFRASDNNMLAFLR